MRTALVVLSLAVICLACGGEMLPGKTGLPTVTPTYDSETLKMKYDLVMSLIQDLSCTDDSQCGSFALGVKACGGPAKYVVFSTAHVDGKALSDAVADFNAYDAGWQAQEGILSDCSLAQDANPACVQNQCVDQR